MSNAEKVLDLARTKGVIRPRDLVDHRIPRVYLTRLVRAGLLERVARGLYVLSGADVTENRSLAEVSKQAPVGVICLLSALRFHGLTTQNHSKSG